MGFSFKKDKNSDAENANVEMNVENSDAAKNMSESVKTENTEAEENVIIKTDTADEKSNGGAVALTVGQNTKGKQALVGGSYSLVMICFVLAIVIVINIMASYLPANITKFDISSSRLYSITSNTKVVVNSLSKDVDIYWIVQADEEDSVISNLLDKYESLSDNITVTKKNPDVYPTFAEQYTDDSSVPNNSLVVVCGDKYRYISYNDIYQSTTSYSYSSYGSQSTSFDGEGQITSAIKYVVSDEAPIVYRVTGHGEEDLPETFSDQITKSNYDVEDLSIVSENAIPDDAAAVLIYAPSSDISEEEESILATYVEQGGKLMVVAGPTQDGTLTNLYTLLSDYGVSSDYGVVIDVDSEHYGFGVPYVLLPTINSDDLTDSLIDDGYYVIMPISQGLTVGDVPTSATVTSLLTTSESSYNKVAGYGLTTYDKEDGDTYGPFDLAEKITNSDGGEMIWFSSSVFLEDEYNSYSSGANVTLAVNSLSELVGDTDSISIAAKSLGSSYLTINTTAANTLKVVMLGVCPGAFAAAGIVIVMRRRRLKNHA